MDTWMLAASYWLHLLATILWIGGLASGVLVVRAVLGAGAESDRLSDLYYRRFKPVANLSLAVLAVTGMLQLVGEKAPNYQGTLNFSTLWAQIILAKHVVIGAMVLAAAYMQGSLDPALRRAIMLAEAGKGVPGQVAVLRRRRMQALGASLALGIVVLALTAAATSL